MSGTTGLSRESRRNRDAVEAAPSAHAQGREPAHGSGQEAARPGIGSGSHVFRQSPAQGRESVHGGGHRAGSAGAEPSSGPAWLREPDLILALLALWEAAEGEAPELAVLLRRDAGVGRLCDERAFGLSDAHWRRARRRLVALRLLGIRTVAAWQIPPRLARAGPLPPALFVRGEAALLWRAGLAVVGARRASAAAAGWALERAAAAARAGLLVVSGGARGVDAAAHGGALREGAPTLAYLGVAADRIYPAGNRRLFAAVLRRGGALVSEHPPGVRTFGSAHAMRNRFIAAHASMLLVAEAREGSGSLGTAKFARRLGVPVLVAPPEVGGERAGIDWLLERGHASVWSPAIGPAAVQAAGHRPATSLA